MKTQVLILMMVLGSSQAFSMGKPTNLFAARKQLNSKIASVPVTAPASQSHSWRVTREVKSQINLLEKAVTTFNNFRRYAN